MNVKSTNSLMQLFSQFKGNRERSIHRARELCARYMALGIKNERLEKELFVLLLNPQKNHLFQKLQKEIALCEGLSLIAPTFGEYDVKTGENGKNIIIGLSRKNQAPVLISQKDFSRHLLCMGSTGSTKTSLSKWIILKNPQLRCVLVFSFLKEEFEDLIPALLQQGRKVYIVYGDALGANIFEMCPKISFAKQLSSLTQVLCEALEIPPYNKILLRNLLKKMYATGHMPTLRQFITLLHEGSREGRFLQERGEYLSDSLGDDVSHGWTIDKLLNLDAVILFQLNRLEKPIQLFLTKWILTQLFNYKIDNPEDTRFCSVFLDECHLVAGGKGSILESTISTIRVAAGCFLMTQTPTSLSTTFLANCNTKLFGELRSLQDLEIARQYGMLTSREMEFLRREMVAGQFLAIVPGHAPFLTTFPFVKYPRVTNEDLQRATLPLEVRGVVFEAPTKPLDAELVLPLDAEKLLINVHESPFLVVTKRCAMLSFTFKRFNKARDILLRQDFVEEVEIKLGQQKGRPKVYDLKEKAKDYLIKLGYDVTHSYRGSLEHRYFEFLVEESFKKKDIPVRVEKKDENGHVPDVCAYINGQWLPIEIVLDSREAQMERIVRKLNDYPALIIVLPDKQVQKQTKDKLLPAINGKNVRFSLISEFL